MDPIGLSAAGGSNIDMWVSKIRKGERNNVHLQEAAARPTRSIRSHSGAEPRTAD